MNDFILAFNFILDCIVALFNVIRSYWILSIFLLISILYWIASLYGSASGS